VTGGAGFIGSNFVRLLLAERPTWRIVILDALTYSGNASTMQDILDGTHVQFVHGRIEDEELVGRMIREHGVHQIVNFAAESHNDRSLLRGNSFLVSNALGVENLLNHVREYALERMLHVSTDEVYGSISEGKFTETTPLAPNTPYSASKAAGDLQCRAHFVAYKTPVVVTRGGNTYGPFQYPEKLIPFFLTRLMDDKVVPLYGDGSQVREWIHVEDHARGILTVLEHGELGQVYNVGDENERQNIEVLEILLSGTGRDARNVKHIEDPRKGAHDARYSMDASRTRHLGWKPQRSFHDSLLATIRWYQENEAWWRPITQNPDYKAFINSFYGKYLGDLL
jgi:dTDP-glucose 4,6-dehydratase